MTAYVFDLCGTLIRENTTKGFLLYLFRGKFLHRALIVIICSIVMAKLSHILGKDLSRLLLIRFLKGRNKLYLYSQSRLYVQWALNNKINEYVIKAVNEAKRNGCKLVLASSTIDSVAHAVGELLEFDYVVCSKLLYKKEVCAGRFELDITGRKWHFLNQLLKNDEIIVYTDNPEDIDMIVNSHKTYFLGNKFPQVYSPNTKIIKLRDH